MTFLAGNFFVLFVKEIFFLTGFLLYLFYYIYIEINSLKDAKGKITIKELSQERSCAEPEREACCKSC